MQGIEQTSGRVPVANPGIGSVAGGSAERALAWRRSLAAWALATLCLIALFWQTAWSMVLLWFESSAYGHSILILPACAYLVWLRRAALGALTPAPWLPAAIATVAPAVVWLLGDLTGTQIVQQYALVVMFQLITWAVFGTPVIRTLLFPLFFLFFAVPFGSFLIAPLQDFTAQFVVAALQLTGLPVYIEGWMIYIPTGVFHVAEACAGLRFLLTTLALGFLAANLLYRSLWRRALFVALSILVPLVGNGLRAFTTIMVAHLGDYRLAIGENHLVYGLIFLSLVTFCLLGLGQIFRERDLGRFELVRPAPARDASETATTIRVVTVCLVAILGIVSARTYGLYAETRLASAAEVDFPRLAAPEAWEDIVEVPTGWRPRFDSADRIAHETFRRGETVVKFFVALYAQQRQGHEVVTPANRFAPDREWSISQAGRVEAVVEGQAMTLRFLRLQRGNTRKLVWYWFWVDGRYTANPYVAKLLDARAKILGGDTRAAVLAVCTNEDEGPAKASEDLQKFLHDVGSIRSVLEATSRLGQQPG